MNGRQALVSAAVSQAMDAEAVSQWACNNFALVEAAGRRAAQVLTAFYPRIFDGPPDGPPTLVLAGTGNNGADAMVILRTLILSEYLKPERALLCVIKLPGDEDRNPRSELYRALKKMGVPDMVHPASGPAAPGPKEKCRQDWEGFPGFGAALEKARLIIDGLAGTGLKGPLREDTAQVVREVNGRGGEAVLVSVDLPSGLFDNWKPGMPIVTADAVLAIEPEKGCLYKPAARPHCGHILHVGGIFPPALTAAYEEAELVSWEYGRTLVPPVPPESYKYSRGLVEIRAGSPGTAGAARIAARGAQAAGAGLVRLLVDPPIYPVLASSASGIMVDVPRGGDETAGPAPESSAGPPGVRAPRFKPDALLLGPGWGRGVDRLRVLEEALRLEEEGTPLVLDADAIILAKEKVFHGNVLLTPHPGELAAYSGVPRDEFLANPAPLLLALAREKRGVILFKSHVMVIASAEGRLAVVDGMKAALSAGGSGDLLAGLCAGIAARCRGIAAQDRGIAARGQAPDTRRPAVLGPDRVDLYACAVAGASLLIRAAGDPRMARRFADPLEFADIAADLAGRAWLPADRP